MTKELAWMLLRREVPVEHSALLQFVLRTNRTGMGSWARSLEATPWRTMAGSFGYLAVGGYLLFFQKKGQSFVAKIVWSAVAFALGCAVAVLMRPVFASLPYAVLVALARVGTSFLFLSLWWLSRAGVWRTATTLFSAAALGNLLGLVLPPHEIVDFVYSRPLSTIFRQGVANVADLFYDAGVVCLAFLIVRRILLRWRGVPRGA
ncbi:MAG TPA: signal peptidase II [Polyangiaceae bacterium]